MISVRAARLLDRYGGLLACALLAPSRIAAPRQLPSAPERVLVLKFWEGGLIVMGAPWFRALRRRYPGAKIDFLTLDVNAQPAGMAGAADSVLSLRVTAGLPAFFLDLLRLLPRLRAARYDLVLDLEFMSRFSAVLTALLRPRCAVGFSHPGAWRGRFHDVLVPFRGDRHMTENYAAFFAAAGVTAGPEDRVPLEAAAEVPGLPAGERPVVLNFDRKDVMPERAWPREHYLALLDRLLAAGHRVAVIGQRRTELPDKASLYNLSGLLDYRQLATLFARAALFITHDSGPLHIAAAMGCRTVSIFGPETPAGYAPLGPGHRAMYLGLPCSPCVNALRGKELVCLRRSNECVTNITPEMVMQAAQDLLAYRGETSIGGEASIEE